MMQLATTDIEEIERRAIENFSRTAFVTVADWESAAADKKDTYRAFAALDMANELEEIANCMREWAQERASRARLAIGDMATAPGIEESKRRHPAYQQRDIKPEAGE